MVAFTIFEFFYAGGVVPYAILGILFALLIYIIVDDIRHKSPGGPRSCTRCGYILTGNVSGICPECGAPVDSLWQNADKKRT